MSKTLKKIQSFISRHGDKIQMLKNVIYAVEFYKNSKKARRRGNHKVASDSTMLMLCALAPLVEYLLQQWEDYRNQD